MIGQPIELGHNLSSVTGSRYFSPYFCLSGRNLVLPIDSKTLRSKHSGHTDVDEHVRALLLKLDHVRELARRNVVDFKQNYKAAYGKKYKTKPTKLRVGIMSTLNRNVLRLAIVLTSHQIL